MKKKSTIRKILNYIKKYRWLMLLSILLAALTVVLTLYVPILVGKAIDCIVAPGKVNFSILGYLLIQLAIVAALTALFQWIMNMINNRVTYHVVRDIRADAFRKIQILPLKFLDAHQSGEIISRVIADVDQFADGLLMGFTQLFSGIVTILVTLVFMLFINVKITLVVVLLTPVSLFVANFVAKHTYQLFRCQSEIRA
ncbi:MAG: ABC transporter transmembrane domain-containing protein, partial [Eubacteriales bacterium]